MARSLVHHLIRTAVVSAVSLGAVSLIGCADAITFSHSETARGRTYLSEGDYESAAIIFANQTRRGPRDYEAHYYLGLSQLGAGRSAEAIRSFKTGLEVMKLTPSGQADDEFRFLLVDALSSALAEHDADGSQLAQIEQAAKGDETLKLLVAMTHAKAGRPDAAIAAFRSAMTLDRNNPRIAKQFGLYLESIQQDDAAAEVLKRAYALNTSDEQVAAALRRLGYVPGPSLLSKNDLTRPAVPMGPLPEWGWWEEEPAQADAEQAGQPSQPAQAPAQQPIVAPVIAPAVTPAPPAQLPPAPTTQNPALH